MQAAVALVGPDKVDANGVPTTVSEDFAFMLEARPGCFVMIGNGLAEDGTLHSLHTAGYEFNDAILNLGAAYWVELAHIELGGPH